MSTEMTTNLNADAEPTRETPLARTEELTQVLPESEATTVLPVADTADAEPTAVLPQDSAAETQALPVTEREDATQALPLTEPADATQALPFARPDAADRSAVQAADPADPAGETAEARDVDAVWSASTLAEEPTEPRDLDRPRSPRASTVMWGTFLLACGLLTVVLGLGTHISLTVASIVVLAATGLSLLLVALIPQRGDAGPTSA